MPPNFPTSGKTFFKSSNVCKIFPRRLPTSVKFLCAAGLLLAAAPARSEIVIRPDALRQAYLGFGVQLWYGNAGAEASIPELAIRVVRVGVPGFDKLPDSAESVRAIADHFTSAVKPESFHETHDMLRRHGVSLMLNAFHLPKSWLDRRNELKEDRIERLAQAWVGAVTSYDERGARPRYLELFNEPDGDWNVRCPPERYNRVVKAVRRALDEHGFQDVHLVGPGLAHIDLMKPWKTRDEWIEALDDDAVRALAAWSIHGYEWKEPERNDPDWVRRTWADGFMASIARRAPDSRNPIFLTEFGSFARAFPSGDCVSVRDRHGDTCAARPAWCVRVMENTFSFLNGGAGAFIYWEWTDPDWAKTDFGLLGRRSAGFPKKMLYHAFTGFFPELREGRWRVVEVAHSPDQPLYAAALRRDARLVVGVVNRDLARQTTQLRVEGAERLRVLREHRFVNGARESVEDPRDEVGSFEVELPPESVFTFVLEMLP